MALEIDQIARGTAVFVRIGTLEEIVEADIVQGCRGCEGGDVPAQAPGPAVCANHHGQRVPANERTDAAFHEEVAGHEGFTARRYGVAVGRGDRIRQARAGPGHPGRKTLEQKVGPVHTVVFQDVFQGIQPFAGLFPAGVYLLCRFRHAANIPTHVVRQRRGIARRRRILAYPVLQ